MSEYLQQFKDKWGLATFYLRVISLFAIAVAAGFGLGYGVTDLVSAKLETQQNSLNQLNQENNQLQRRLNIIGVELEIEKRANQQAQRDLQNAIEESQQIRQELSFYQKVMAPELNEDGFVIDSLDIESMSTPGRYHMAMVLMQQERRKTFVKGSIKLYLKGSQNGQAVTLGMDQLGLDAMNFEFRYFEVLKADFQLPDGFTPDRFEVQARLTSKGSKQANYERTFNWRLTSMDVISG